MRIFVYGFKPYADYTSNITEQVLARIDETQMLKKRVFDVRFDAAMFNETLARIRPDRIIGLGHFHPFATLSQRCATTRKLWVAADIRLAKNMWMF